MKKIIFIVMVFLYSFNVSAGDIYISKRDIDTDQYVSDCDFLLYDQYGNVVDRWVQDNTTHVSNVPLGFYRLIERPYIDNVFVDSMSKSYDFNLDSDDIFEITIYNAKMETPRNLHYKRGFVFPVLLIISGVVLIFNRKFHYI